MRSLTRNGERPPAITTNTSGSARSVHPTGIECWKPSSSTKNPRSSPHVWRRPANTNSRPNLGWNGWVTRTVLFPESSWGVVDGLVQQFGRELLQHAATRAPRRAPLGHPPPARPGHLRIDRVLVQTRRAGTRRSRCSAPSTTNFRWPPHLRHDHHNQRVRRAGRSSACHGGGRRPASAALSGHI